MTILTNEKLKISQQQSSHQLENKFHYDNVQGYSVDYISHLNSLIIFGTLINSTDIHLFSLENLKGLIIHGGEIIDKSRKTKCSSNECYVLFVDGWNWKKLFLHEVPEARQYHEFIAISSRDEGEKGGNIKKYSTRNEIIETSKGKHKSMQKNLLIFGGFNKPYETVLDDLWCLSNLGNLNLKSNKHEIHGCEVTQIKTKGKTPKVYGYSHKVINTKLLILGGEHEICSEKLEVYVLCLRTLEWTHLDIQNNEICSALLFPKSYFSSTKKEKLYIMGGYANSDRFNTKVYILNLKEITLSEEKLSKTPEVMLHSCKITTSPLCFCTCEWDLEEEEMNIFLVYEKEVEGEDLIVHKHFETDDIESGYNELIVINEQEKNKNNNNIIDNNYNNHHNEIEHNNGDHDDYNIEEYLKAIKHEQILSQELIKKNMVLEELYKEFQRYVSKMYSNYVKYSDVDIPEIEQEKERNIHNCEKLKRSYIKSNQELTITIQNIKRMREDLGEVQKDFQRCIETEMEEEDELVVYGDERGGRDGGGSYHHHN